MNKLNKKVKVVVAMSGGVDSSVAAALLKKGIACPELGRRDVVGVFMKFWPQYYSKAEYGVNRQNRCCSTDAEKRARMVAKKLGIPFYVFNFEKEFKKRVVDYFLNQNKLGLTPNPCVVCNKEIKFGLLLEKALKLGADYVATGHYAQIKRKGAKLLLLRGADSKKDQSYFLWQLNQKQLKRILFPVGGYTKEEVRQLAKRYKLPTAKTPESMEICFIQSTVNDFLKKYLKSKKGDIINKNGEIIGTHQGLWFYTIGQRKGLQIARGRASGGIFAGKPWYVLDKDVKKNLLIITQNEKDLFSKELITEGVNWLSGKTPKLPLKVMAKIRYRHTGGQAVITRRLRSSVYSLRFNSPQRAITPGQSVVFLKGKELIGGGIIK